MNNETILMLAAADLLLIGVAWMVGHFLNWFSFKLSRKQVDTSDKFETFIKKYKVYEITNFVIKSVFIFFFLKVFLELTSDSLMNNELTTIDQISRINLLVVSGISAWFMVKPILLQSTKGIEREESSI